MPFCSFSENTALFDSTPIENSFIVEYMPEARGDALRVYLYARMLCLHPEMVSSIEEIAKALHMVEDDVYEAFSYWEKKGLVEKLQDRPAKYAIRPLNSRSFISQAFAIVDKYKDLRDTVDKMFEGNDYVHEKQFSMLKDWIEDLHYSEKAALRILEYEMKLPGGKKPPAVFKRADKRAIEWSERGIRTLEEVEDAIRYDGRIYHLASMVIGELSLNHIPTKPELECARRWIEEYNVTEQDVLNACGETLKSRAPSFGYLDSVLRNSKFGEDEKFKQVQNLLTELGMIGSKPSPSQIHSYQQWLDKGFEAETILLAAAQCVQKDKHDFRALSWMLKEWSESGVYTHMQAQIFLEERQKIKYEAGEILKRAGLNGEPGKIALNYYEGWKAKHPQDIIIYAADLAKGKNRYLDYMNRLLEDWEKAGISTLDAAKADHARATGGKKPAGVQGNPANFQQRSYTKEESEKDYFDLEKFFAEEENKA